MMIYSPGERRVFMARTAAAYRSIERAAAPRYWSQTVCNEKLRGKLRIAGNPVDFSIEQFRAWVAEQFTRNHSARLTKRECAYCSTPISVLDFSVDHKIPAAKRYGGLHQFSNLCLCCVACNKAKGIMTAEQFKWFRQTIFANLPEEIAEHVLRSLRIAEVQRQQFFAKKKPTV